MRDVAKCIIGWLVVAVAITSLGCRHRAAKTSPVSAATTTTETGATSIRVNLDSRRPAQKLSEYGLFQSLADQVPAEGVVPYELIVTSFVDYGIPRNYIYVPPGQTATFQAEGPFDFPVGTILVQNICFHMTRVIWTKDTELSKRVY